MSEKIKVQANRNLKTQSYVRLRTLLLAEWKTPCYASNLYQNFWMLPANWCICHPFMTDNQQIVISTAPELAAPPRPRSRLKFPTTSETQEIFPDIPTLQVLLSFTQNLFHKMTSFETILTSLNPSGPSQQKLKDICDIQ